MGFKWAVYIAHTIAAQCMKHAFAAMKASHGFPEIPCQARLVTMLRGEGLIVLRSGDILLLHIIDDVNPICIDWPAKAVIALNVACAKTLSLIHI